jgi:excisionase family DNA binding protein
VETVIGKLKQQAEVGADELERLVAGGLLTIGDACRFLSLGRASLYKLMCSGDLPFVKIGGARRIPKQALVELAQRHLIGPAHD